MKWNLDILVIIIIIIISKSYVAHITGTQGTEYIQTFRKVCYCSEEF